MYFGGYPTPAQQYDPELEKESLKNRSQVLQAELDAIKERLKDIDSNDA
jgi:predicted nuclease with TOPRIM domain